MIRFVFWEDRSIQTRSDHMANAWPGSSRKAQGTSGPTLQDLFGLVMKKASFSAGVREPPSIRQGFWQSWQGHTVRTPPGRSSNNILDWGLTAEFLEHVPMSNKPRACPTGNSHSRESHWLKLYVLFFQREWGTWMPFTRCMWEETTLSLGNYSKNLL